MDNEKVLVSSTWDDELHEECGVFGIYDFDGKDVASTIYYGLFALQHRGQESCGIAVSETNGPKGKVTSYKGMGLVNEVFAPENLESLHGDIGVGHTRYSTAGASTRENAQPLVLNYVKGTLALAHNGNLINAAELRRDLEYTGAIFQTTIDSEVIAYHIARERLNSKTAEEAVNRACLKIKGAYALVVMSPRKLMGARDPSSLFVLVNVTMRTSWHPRPVHWIPSVQSMYVMSFRERPLRLPLRMALYQICQELCLRKRKPDVSLNIFILQDLTAILTVSAYMHPELRQDVSLPWIHL